ncbi:DUF547 domain-containing protein [Parvibaculum sp.]|jgi:hypothetical protein|uniref:DUF547 domain-containing protein n=1 Tax=Parvibaculum sp. TaxID=2024848 RepID=UPI0025CE613F|nr:DUF547 domain-containing protein [Parvibaculum sp.]
MTPDHDPWARLLQSRLTEGEDGAPNRFDYGGLKASPEERAALKAYIASLETVDPEALSRDEAFAFWVNLYNALTVEVVVEHYPVASIRDIDISPGLFSNGPWGRKLVTVDGRELSLDDIEHGILRPEFGDSRVHYAVNCASVGCPDLAAEPYRGEGLDAMLDAAARAYVNSPRGARFEGGELTASSIFKWYMKDFGGTEEGVLAELRRYAGSELRGKLENVEHVASYDYDWSLNDTAELENGK